MNDSDLKVLVAYANSVAALAFSVAGGLSISELPQALQVAEGLPAAIAAAKAAPAEWLALGSQGEADMLAYIQANVSVPSNANVQKWAQVVLSIVALLSAPVAEAVAAV